MRSGDMFLQENEPLPCAGKLVFDTKKQAAAGATVALHQHGTKLRIYRCRYCGLWHLSSDYS